MFMFCLWKQPFVSKVATIVKCRWGEEKQPKQCDASGRTWHWMEEEKVSGSSESSCLYVHAWYGGVALFPGLHHHPVCAYGFAMTTASMWWKKLWMGGCERKWKNEGGMQERMKGCPASLPKKHPRGKIVWSWRSLVPRLSPLWRGRAWERG